MTPAPYFGYVTVDIFDCPPFFMFTNNDCPGCKSIREGRFEPGSMRLWCALARNATGILDVGANVGIYSLAAAALRNDIRIHAFEPNPHAFARLRVNKNRNGFANIVEHQEALGHEDGRPITLTWRLKPGNPISSGSAIGDQQFGGAVETSIAVLRRVESMQIPDLGARPAIKIDVEGAETYVCQGMGEAILERRPDIILESFHPQPCDDITALTKPRGYRYFSIDEDSGALTEQDRLIARVRNGENFNQFLTTRDPPV